MSLSRRFPVLLAVVAVSSFGLLGLALSLFSSAQTTPSVVTVKDGKLYVNEARFDIRGVNYDPIATGTDQLDTDAPAADVPKIKALGANTIGTYMMGKTEYQTWSDLPSGEALYDNLMPLAESNGLYVIVGYYANQTIDWTDSTRVAKVTAQYQELVTKSKNSPATLMYMVGNEIFEKMSDDTQRKAYAQWIGQMTDWTHTNDPNHPVIYADNNQLPALSWLKQYAPSLDIYGINDYDFTDATTLSTNLTRFSGSWPGKPILLHEWGADSWNVTSKQEDFAMQSTAISNLAKAVDTVTARNDNVLLGGLNFEYSDAWDFVGGDATQDSDAGWDCTSCGDGKANEDYWGLTKATPAGQAASRQLKPAYTALQLAWTGTTPTPTPTPPPPTPTPPTTVPGDVNKDGKVNLTDLSILLKNWKSTDAASDLNGNGTVDLTDLSILLGHWGAKS